MNYETVLVDLPLDAARRRVLERVNGVAVRERGGAVEVHGNAGHHLATLAPATLPDGSAGTRLRYRTAMVSPVHATARRRARAVYDALADRRYGSER